MQPLDHLTFISYAGGAALNFCVLIVGCCLTIRKQINASFLLASLVTTLWCAIYALTAVFAADSFRNAGDRISPLWPLALLHAVYYPLSLWQAGASNLYLSLLMSALVLFSGMFSVSHDSGTGRLAGQYAYRME